MGHGGGPAFGFANHNPRTASGRPVFDPAAFRGFTYLFGTPPADKRSKWGEDLEAARTVFAALYDALPQVEQRDNPNIPAGYTYLLQLVAHDVVNSTEPLWVAAESDITASNARSTTLQLDTLYGGGPTICPLAFVPATGETEPDYATQLRIGRVSDAAALQLTGACPFRDLPRVTMQAAQAASSTAGSTAAAPASNGATATPPASNSATAAPQDWSGAVSITATFQAGNTAGAASQNGPTPQPTANFDNATQLYIADIRNGEGSILSQVAVLFFILHNAVAGKLSAQPPAAQFDYARVAVLRMYHGVIRHDLLRRLLHADIYARLSTRPASSPDWLWTSAPIPYEFSHGAFRIGHGMPRPRYDLNTILGQELTLGDLLQGGFHGGPLPANWIVEWGKFFEFGGTPNYALRFNATQSLALNGAGVLQNVAPDTPLDMSLRDWLSAAAARMWRTGALVEQVESHYPGLPYLRPQAVETWLAGLIQSQTADIQAVLQPQLSALAADLPLPLYVLLESQLDPQIDGTRAGVFASILIGEVLFWMLATEEANAEHAALLAAAKAALGDDWTEIEAVRSMPDLVRLAEKWGGLQRCRTPGFIVTPPQEQEHATMTGVPTPRFQVADMARWGRLIKSWATHLDYVMEGYNDQPPRTYWVNTTWNNPEQPAPVTVTDMTADGMPKPWCLPPMSQMSVPRPDNTTVTLPGVVALTVDEFKQRVTAAGVEITQMPVQYKNVIVLQGDAGTMVLRLPPKDTLQGSEDDLLNGYPYSIAAFYNGLWGGSPPTTMPKCPPDRDGVMKLHANRIGEYTLNNCS